MLLRRPAEPLTLVKSEPRSTRARAAHLECYSPCTIRFETRDDVDHRILAFCDDQLQDWYSFDFGQHYGRMIVLPLDE